MKLGKKNSGNLEQLDYLQDLNRVLFSNVVDQVAQKIEYYLAYTTWGGGGARGDNQANSSCKITSIHKSSLAPGRFSATNVHRHVSDGFNDTNEIGGDFHKSPVNYMALDFLCNSS
jgi:hypothetical protein